jgi:DNA segregation ATPase FtsK/SpoIIIE, S-DNA-T family
VGQREDAVSTCFTVGAAALSRQGGPDARLILLNGFTPGDAAHEALGILEGNSQGFQLTEPHDLDETMKELGSVLDARAGENQRNLPPVVLMIPFLERYRALRHDPDLAFSLDGEPSDTAGAILRRLLTEGPAFGMHVIVSIDTFNNVNRCLGRRTLAEFDQRVLFQMSATDSASLMDAPDAAHLGHYRAIIFEESGGRQEVFRPYAQPATEWFKNLACK